MKSMIFFIAYGSFDDIENQFILTVTTFIKKLSVFSRP